ncbi:DUF4097 family beta strand repeat-containing protein [Nonomuraea sp. NPDC000554]|uniref:DUF4097 family beta strand repeat-containing protein n=1 Tax=Nonomuraea sp. NPDC000554 TaxID=3154259 RepID=UPI003326F794
MPAFDTPEPIDVTIDLAVGDVRVYASDRADTVVDVRPSDPSSDADVRAAEQTRVEYSHGRLLVKGPRKRDWSLFGWGGSVDVTVELPSGSGLDAKSTGGFRSDGRLGDCRLTTASGDIWLDETGKLRLDTASGDISVSGTSGQAEVTTANGEIRMGRIDGRAVLRTANGDITLGEVTGDLRLNTSSGDITVDRALAGVDARTAYGSVRIGEVVRGSVSLQTAYGELELGVREGTAAWLDVRTLSGTVRSSLNPSDGPAPSDETVEVHARTAYGDIVIRRSARP